MNSDYSVNIFNITNLHSNINTGDSGSINKAWISRQIDKLNAFCPKIQ